MFKKIMIPVDLAHTDRLSAALQAGADLARHYGADVVYVGVSASTPSALGHTPKEYETHLAEFAAKQAAEHGITATGHAEISHDPTSDLEPTLLKVIDTVNADLVVMASHVPGLADRIWPSHGGRIAERAKISVMVVRA